MLQTNAVPTAQKGVLKYKTLKWLKMWIYFRTMCKFHSHAIELIMWHCKEVLAMSRELKGQKQLWGVWPSSRGPEFGRHLLFAATWSPLGNPAQPSGPRWLQCNPPIRQFLVQIILSVQALATTSKCKLARKCWTEASSYSGKGEGEREQQEIL